MFPEAIGRLSMTTIEAGHGSVFKEIFYDKAKSLSMKQGFAPVSKRAKK
jgi:hypothetical protein